MRNALLHRCTSMGLALSLATGTPGLSGQDVTTPDVDLLARTILQDLDALRWHMGRPPEVRDPIPVEDVAIRENFRQAMSLWQKINQLGIELVGGGEAPPVVRVPAGAQYGPAHVQVILSSALERLDEIREGVGIVGAVEAVQAGEPLEVDPSATPSDVFQTIVQGNRQLNRMLEQPVQPGDVYQLVQQAVFYSSEILAAVEDGNPLPTAPAYEPGLQPAHVYGRLLSVFDRLAAVFDELDLQMVDWRGGAYVVDESLAPSDVYDVATLLLAELEYLHSSIPGARAPLQAPHPGRRWPSDVYQQAGVLAEQATRIMAQARTDPGSFGVRGR